MRLARDQGKITYFRAMNELAEWGYIEYRPTRDKGEGVG